MAHKSQLKKSHVLTFKSEAGAGRIFGNKILHFSDFSCCHCHQLPETITTTHRSSHTDIDTSAVLQRRYFFEDLRRIKDFSKML